MRPVLLDAVLFQLGWIACVAGGNSGALLAALLVLPLHWALVSRDAREWLFAIVLGSAGLAVDLAWQAAGALHFAQTVGGVLPPWLAVLWLLFALALFHSLAWLQGRPLLAASCGALAGPVTYLAGLRLGAAESALAPVQLALLMAPAWAVLLPALAETARLARRARATESAA
jgi:hypothetical protein